MDQLGCISLKPIIESANGEHISIYISNTGSVIDLKKKIRKSTVTARGFMRPDISKEKTDELLAPIERLAENGHMLTKFSGSIVIFRAKNFLRVLNIPTDMTDLCVVASTFHVKPILKWSQLNQDFILLGAEKNMVHLYRSSTGNIQHIDSLLFPKKSILGSNSDDYGYRKGDVRDVAPLVETWDWINSWIEEIPEQQRTRLFVAGNSTFSKNLLTRIRYENKHPEAISDHFNTGNIHNVIQRIRSIRQSEAETELNEAIADLSNVQSNLFEISRLAFKGKIEKLIISEDREIFGKFCLETGGLKIHPISLDHEDDDILDDLAQQVLRTGGRVLVTSEKEIPSRTPAMAILKKQAG